MGPDGSLQIVLPGLAGRRAVVTGAAHGIGLATARVLAGSGACVLSVDRDEDRLRATCASYGAHPVVGDLSTATPELAERILALGSPVELLVNNVGITTQHGFLDLDRSNFDTVVATNLVGPWYFTRTLVQHLVASGQRGSIVFVTSVHSVHVRTHPHYSATKAALAMLVKEMGLELGPRGIRVNAVAPGWIRTEPYVEPAAAQALTARIPARRPGTAEDVAAMIAVLLSDLAGYVTGVELTVDGGLSLHTWLTEP